MSTHPSITLNNIGLTWPDGSTALIALTGIIGTIGTGRTGLEGKLAALHAIARGDVAEGHFEVLGDDWDIETRAAEALRPIGLGPADPDRRVSTISGGETVLVAIVGLRLRRASSTHRPDEPRQPSRREDRHEPVGV